MFRNILFPILLGVLFQTSAQAQATDNTGPTVIAYAPKEQLEPSLRDAIRHVTKGKGTHKGRMLANWVGHRAGRCLNISVR